MKWQSSFVAWGHDVLAVQEPEQRWASGLDDPAQLEIAAQQKRVLVTYNIRDFAPVSQAWAQERHEHYGIIMIHPSTIPPNDIGGPVRRLAEVLAAHTTDDAILNQVLFLS